MRLSKEASCRRLKHKLAPRGFRTGSLHIHNLKEHFDTVSFLIHQRMDNFSLIFFRCNFSFELTSLNTNLLSFLGMLNCNIDIMKISTLLSSTKLRSSTFLLLTI